MQSQELKQIRDVQELEDALSEPTAQLEDDLRQLGGDLLILGVGGKMGPSLARMARRTFQRIGSARKVIGVSTFSKPGLESQLQSWEIETLKGDLLDAEFVRSLPITENVLYLVGMKFGTIGAAALTWATNTFIPGLVCERCRTSRMVALSTGNVYRLVPVESGGAVESDAPEPSGEYAMSAWGRERIFEFFSRKYNTPIAVIRLNYATELRYGVLVDLAHKVHRGEKVALDMGYFNVIWQRDACEMILRSFLHTASPPSLFNVTGPERLSCRNVCEQLAQLLGRPASFTGTECETALLSNARRAISLFGRPRATIDQMLAWTANWTLRGGETWGRPTHFETRDGKF
jgi:nucleoside-diphosphate-sugar epimerase